MNYSKDGMALTEYFEGFRSEAYLDQGGVPTIGFGHTLGVHMGMTCTQEEANAWLLEDVKWAANAVNLYVKVGITQEQFDALTDFCFNVGITNFKNSSMLAYLNTNQLEAAIAEFDKWDHVGGQVVAGLLRRRDAETALFTLGTDFTKDATPGEPQPQPEESV